MSLLGSCQCCSFQSTIKKKQQGQERSNWAFLTPVPGGKSMLCRLLLYFSSPYRFSADRFLSSSAKHEAQAVHGGNAVVHYPPSAAYSLSGRAKMRVEWMSP